MFTEKNKSDIPLKLPEENMGVEEQTAISKGDFVFDVFFNFTHI